MNPPNVAFRISDSEYNSIKAFIGRCWAKFPQYVKRDDMLTPLSIEMDEDSSAPIGSTCWFVKRSLRNLIAVSMNQSSVSFEKEFIRTFNIFKTWDTGEGRNEKVQNLQGRENASLLLHQQQNLQEMCLLLKKKSASPFGYIPKEAS